MAFNYPDYTPNYTLGETEEERRRREEEERRRALEESANVQDFQSPTALPVIPEPPGGDLANTEVQTQTVKTYGDGSQEEITKRQIPAEPQQPVAPEQVQPQIQPIASPVAQAAPVAPTPAPTAAPQMSMEERIAAAAQRAQERAAASSMQQPQQQPQPAPVPPVQLPQAGPGVQVAGPTAVPQAPYTGPGISMPTAAPVSAPGPGSMEERIATAARLGQMPAASVGSLQEIATQQQVAPSFETRFTEASNDISKLDQLRKDETLTKAQRMLAGRQAQDLLMRELGPEKAKDEIANMSELEMARLLKSKSEEGSWGKLLLLGFISPRLAAKEAAKLGLDDQWTVGTDSQGNSVLLKTRDGVPIEGINGSTGKSLSAKELISAAGQQLGKHVTTTAETYLDDAGNRYRSQTDEKGNSRLVNIATGARFSGDATKLKRQMDVSSMARVDYGLATDLLKKHSGNVLDMMKEYEMIKGALTPEGRAEFMQRYGYGTTVPKAAQTAPAVTQAAPAVTQAAPQVQQTSAGQIRPAVPGAAAPAVTQAAPTAITTPGVGGGVGTPIGSLQTQQALTKAAGEADIQRRKEVAVAEQKPPAEAKGKVAAKDVNNQAFADETYGLIKPIAELVKKSTGSGIGAKVDSIAAILGQSTEGAQTIAELEPMVYPILANIPRFEGAQSDYDVKTYQKAAGDFANPEKPIKTRLAALQGMITLLKKYDKEGKNDWTFSGQSPAAASATGTTASGNKYKRVQ